MRRFLRMGVILVMLLAAAGLAFAQGKGTLRCVGLYSETSDGSISYRVGSGEWVVVKLGDTIPANAEIRVNVERDWIELTPSANRTAVYELHGPDSGEIIKTVPDILKGKPKRVTFPKVTGGKADPRFKDKLVVGPYLGRQVYETPDGDESDIHYGDVLAKGGKIRIIAINNTIDLYLANGKMTKVIGPLYFEVEKVLSGAKLYKYLNAP